MQMPLSISRACIAGAAALSLSLAVSQPAAAAEPINFFGSGMNTNPGPQNVPPCAAQLINKHDPPTFKSAGFSNLGDFTYNLVQCLNPPQIGSIEYDFGGGNTLVGTWASSGSATSDPLVIQFTAVSDITGGTGTFAGYTGSITALGYTDRRDIAVSGSNFIADSAFVFRGELMQPVPEPTTWGLMLAGLTGVVAVARRRRGGTSATGV